MNKFQLQRSKLYEQSFKMLSKFRFKSLKHHKKVEREKKRLGLLSNLRG